MTVIRNRPLGRDVYNFDYIKDEPVYLAVILRDCMEWIQYGVNGHLYLPCWGASYADPDLGTIIGSHFLRNTDCSSCGEYPEPDGAFYAQLLATAFMFLNQHGLISQAGIDLPSVDDIVEAIINDPMELSIKYRCFFCGHIEVITFDATTTDCSEPKDTVIINQGQLQS